MIQDKTEYFLKIRQRPTNQFTKLTISPIKTQLAILDSFISQLENKIEMSFLPNFGSKEKKFKEIVDLKDKIQKLGKEIEENTKKFDCTEKSVKESVQQYLLNALRISLTKYRNFEQQMISKNDENHQNAYLEVLDSESALLQETAQRNTNIQASIYNVTNTLVQLKIALKTQTSLIDTIDSCFDKSNLYLENANKEIEKIPGKYCGFKDYIIYALLYIICVLLILVFIKSNKERIPWIEKFKKKIDEIKFNNK